MATGTTEHIDVTTADVFLGEIWAKECTVAREASLVFGKLVDRSMEKDLTRGQIVRKQEISNLSARSKDTSNNNAISYETVTESEATLTVDQWYYAAFAVEDVIKIQSMQDLRARYTKKLGYALALQEDDALAALIDAFSQTVGTLATELTDDNLLRADQYLNDANVPPEDRHIVVSPAQKAGFMKMDKFTHRDYRNSDTITKGTLGDIYGYDVNVSSNVDGTNAAGHDNAMFHRDALAIVTQIQPKVESQRDIDYLADKVVAQILYGVKEIRDDHGVCMYGA